MKWKKLGRLYCPEPVHPKLQTHAANPLPLLLHDDVYRVFFSGRDDDNRSSVGSVDIDIVRREVVSIHDSPAFEYGDNGSFYSHGVSIGNCYEADGNRYILFMGWQCPPHQHWRGDVGRLIVNNDLSLELDNEKPFLSIDEVDRVSLSYPWVMLYNGEYHMWYGSTLTWDTGDGEMLHVLNHATSSDGQQWSKHGLAVPYSLGVAQAFSRPTVAINSDNSLSMWFSYRSGTGETYRIGYAHSNDGYSWEMSLAQTGIDVSSSGWDSSMIEYPFVLDHKGKRYMLYNGNDFGRTGFGLAVLE